MARGKSDPNRVVPVEDYEHSEGKRLNNPPAGLAHLDRDETPTRTFSYDPHLDPQLMWTGKEERPEITVAAPSIHVHEELSAERIVGSVRRQRTQAALFDVDRLDPDKQVEFYRHAMDWSNRMILGDSLMVMTSLLERERLGGQAQVVFIDPPYGVNYRSNFQANVNDRNPKEGADQSLTREPETIQAYRDTWELGVHSYLTYLRDRLLLARQLLADSGSVFVQISVDNTHLVRALLDEVFGATNHVNTITFVKTSSAGSPGELRSLPTTADNILWYARDREQLKFRPLFRDKADAASDAYSSIELADGTRRRMTAAERSGTEPLPHGSRIYTADNLTSQSGVDKTRYPIVIDAKEHRPGKGVWKTGEEGMARLLEARRVEVVGNTPRYVRYLDDFAGYPLTELWTDTVTAGFSSDKRYVVQTNPKVIARCVAMASDPGDLVIDPTCGSGTTAFVAEQTGRRWITVDTSRVALAVARERLLTAKFDYYTLRDSARGVDAGLVYDTLQRITLRSIARNEPAEQVTLYDRPRVSREDRKKVRVSGPFTVEALSRYAVNPLAETPLTSAEDATGHIEVLLAALEKQGVPRPGGKPLAISALNRLPNAGAIHAEGVVDTAAGPRRFGVVIGPRFGTVNMALVSDALRQAVGFELVVFAGFAADAETQARLGQGHLGGVDVALLLANPDLLLGDLLRNTTASQTFRLYSAPDVDLRPTAGATGWQIEVNGVDSYDATTGEVLSQGQAGVVAWFLDDDYDGTVFHVSQAFFPVTKSWERLQKALKGTVDAELVGELHTWESLPFDRGDSARCAVRVVTADGNAAEAVLDIPEVAS